MSCLQLKSIYCSWIMLLWLTEVCYYLRQWVLQANDTLYKTFEKNTRLAFGPLLAIKYSFLTFTVWHDFLYLSCIFSLFPKKRNSDLFSSVFMHLSLIESCHLSVLCVLPVSRPPVYTVLYKMLMLWASLTKYPNFRRGLSYFVS